MIINVDSRPEDNIYFIAAMLINILKNDDYNIMNLYSEYQKNNKTSFKREHNRNMEIRWKSIVWE